MQYNAGSSHVVEEFDDELGEVDNLPSATKVTSVPSVRARPIEQSLQDY